MRRRDREHEFVEDCRRERDRTMKVLADHCVIAMEEREMLEMGKKINSAYLHQIAGRYQWFKAVFKLWGLTEPA